jgi:hypothetical protein
MLTGDCFEPGDTATPPNRLSATSSIGEFRLRGKPSIKDSLL